ncbi:preprotein translocase subunit SecA [Rhodopirellula europaea]|jgi:preprotein translocase subunit SecA|uniref:Preprotein translocase subunit SecA n=1 Tax=Rhodopirellula europaea SH398 TaxID=1263868 RepID=M5S6T9_9BACT|nr:preprotein translocase subunit SecA [Rhodopirellula europaea]EMI27348.1 preprotein translocase subunit SecA [Rhodopirellula europaea SH398]MCR9207575.1 preprotein translocase subunit SecA [bacterium]
MSLLHSNTGWRSQFASIGQLASMTQFGRFTSRPAMDIETILQSACDRISNRSTSSNHDLQNRWQTLRYQLLEATADQTRSSSKQPDSFWRECLVDALVLASDAIRATHNIELFEVQLRAGLIVSSGLMSRRGGVAEMQTGEGKTFALFVASLIAALPSRGVHVATPNVYLAQRDHEQLRETWSLLGVESSCLPEDSSADATRAAYRADVTYGPGHAFGFDYLRDQLAMDAAARQRPGSTLLRRLNSEPSTPRFQRGLAVALVDEIDHVLIDDALSPLLLSGTVPGEADDAAVHRHALKTAASLRSEEDFQATGHQMELTDAGLNRAYQAVEDWSDASLRRPWHEYVELALQATHLLRREIDYVIDDDSVRIVDQSTGRIYEDRTWSGGLQQALEAKEDLPIQRESESLAKITRQRFYRSYDYLAGVTGTAGDCREELKSVYGLNVQTVQPRLASKRIVHPTHVTLTAQEKFAAIAVEAQRIAESGRCVLVGTLDIATSHQVAEELRRQGLSCELLNGLQNAEEAEIIARAGQPHAITVATNLAGRGTDIRLNPEVAAKGGLHVIVAEHHRSSRVDRQLIGRCARCGDPGSSRHFLSAEDNLVSQSAPWVGRAIRRAIAADQIETLSVESQIASIQTRQAKRAAAARRQLLEADERDCGLVRKAQSNHDPAPHLQALDAG